ncbi:MAG: glycosyltransferase family 2 protein [Oscillospiraceae bacterium]|jgi:glycosyltransferase involved in cell wall biosynthesis|nr:glycosyltransferase family 2 protein [Oscillospiraceae bacterium]
MTTFILLVYSRENTLPRAIESVIAQTCPDWRLLVVDNAATDAVVAIAAAYAEKDARITVLHRTESNVSYGRLAGIEAALADSGEGDFIAFLDDDDAYAPDFLEKMLPFSREHALDVATSGFHIVWGMAGEPTDGRCAAANLVIEGAGYQDLFLQYQGHMLTVWGKLFTARCMRGMDVSGFAALSLGDDTMMTIEALLHGDRFGVLAERLYTYYLSPNSASTRWRDDHLICCRAVLEAKLRLLTAKAGAPGDENLRALLEEYLTSASDSIDMLLAGGASAKEKYEGMLAILGDPYTIRALYGIHSPGKAAALVQKAVAFFSGAGLS